MNFGRRQVQLTETTLERIARIYAENYGIKVVYKHDLCMTDGKTIGYVDHEVAHCLFSDFGVVKEAAKTGKKHHLLTNAFEDPRIEREMINLWRGTKINLANCEEWSLRQLKKHWDELSEFGKFIQAVISVPYKPDHWLVKELVEQDEETMERIEKIRDLLGTKLIPKQVRAARTTTRKTAREKASQAKRRASRAKERKRRSPTSATKNWRRMKSCWLRTSKSRRRPASISSSRSPDRSAWTIT
jgi:hypothetical protein